METHGGRSEVVRGAGNDAWMREGLRGMASSEGANGGVMSNDDVGIRVRVIE